jgi:hypothetical protein
MWGSVCVWLQCEVPFEHGDFGTHCCAFWLQVLACRHGRWTVSAVVLRLLGTMDRLCIPFSFALLWEDLRLVQVGVYYRILLHPFCIDCIWGKPSTKRTITGCLSLEVGIGVGGTVQTGIGQQQSSNRRYKPNNNELTLTWTQSPALHAMFWYNNHCKTQDIGAAGATQLVEDLWWYEQITKGYILTKATVSLGRKRHAITTV